MLKPFLVHSTHTTIYWPFVWDYPGEPVPEETFTPMLKKKDSHRQQGPCVWCTKPWLFAFYLISETRLIALLLSLKSCAISQHI